MRNFKALVKEANNEIKKTMEFLNSKLECMATRNMKLYDIAWNDELQEKYGLTDDEYIQWFNVFCQHEYDFFVEWMEQEMKSMSCLQYIGRTSSFNIMPQDDTVQLDRYGEIDCYNTVYNYIYNYISYGSLLNDMLDDNGLIDLKKIQRELSAVGNEYYVSSVKDICHTLKDELERLIKDIYKDIQYMMKDVEEIYEYLQGVQDGQVEMFDEFLNCQLEYAV